MPVIYPDCQTNHVVNIESAGVDWSFIYDLVEDIDINISNTPNRSPIPYGTEITDHIKRNMDTVTISGWVSCFRCGGYSTNPNTLIANLKQLSENLIYCRDNFAFLTSNDWQFRYGILTNVNVIESQNSRMTKRLTTTWIGANLTGTTRDPFFERGGFVY